MFESVHNKTDKRRPMHQSRHKEGVPIVVIDSDAELFNALGLAHEKLSV